MLKYYLSFQSPLKGYKDEVACFSSSEHNNLVVLPVDSIFSITLYENNMLYLSYKYKHEVFGTDVYDNVWFEPTDNNWQSVLEVLTAWRFIRPKGVFENLWDDWQYACKFKKDLHPQYYPGRLG